MPKRTYQPSSRRRSRRLGFLASKKRKTRRGIITRRRRKGRQQLTPV